MYMCVCVYKQLELTQKCNKYHSSADLRTYFLKSVFIQVLSTPITASGYLLNCEKSIVTNDKPSAHYKCEVQQVICYLFK